MRRRAGRARRGQFRIIEAAISAVIIFITLVAVNQFMRIPRLIMTGRSGSLRAIAYNTLYRLADTGVLENTLVIGSTDWEGNLKIVLDTLLPSTVYFNLTVYAFSNAEQPTSFSIYNKQMISNSFSQTAFTDTPEISSASFLYVAHNSKIYLLRLQLAEGGVGSY
jgi:hypothetical protein